MTPVRFAWPLAALLPCAVAAQTLVLGWDEVGYDAIGQLPARRRRAARQSRHVHAPPPAAPARR